MKSGDQHERRELPGTRSPEEPELPPARETAQLGTAETGIIRSNPEILLPRLDDILARSITRSCLDAATLVGRAVLQFEQQRKTPADMSLMEFENLRLKHSDRFWQRGDLVHLPKSGTAYIVSDLEGRIDYVERIFRKHNLLPRMMAQDPKDQIYFCVLGDTIDRTTQGSEVLEFLFELRVEHGLERNIIMLAGNHELDPRIQMDIAGRGFYEEVTEKRQSYRTLGSSDFPLLPALIEWYAAQNDEERQPAILKALLPEAAGEGLDVHVARKALWRLYNVSFQMMPQSIITENGLFLSHAGISARGPFLSVADGDAVPRPRKECLAALANASTTPDMTEDLTWSDMSGERSRLSPNMRARDADGNLVAGAGVSFGTHSLATFLELLGARTMIRGHQKYAPEGAEQLSPGAWILGSALTLTTSLDGSYARIDLSRNAAQPDDRMLFHC